MEKGKISKLDDFNPQSIDAPPDTFVAIICASSWINEFAAFESLGKTFKFNEPDWNSTYWNWNFFADWIRELEWIKEKKIDFYIYDLGKENISIDFADFMEKCIVPYWNSIDGNNAKQFNFYYHKA